MARTIKTIKEQNEWLKNNDATIAHVWSTRGMGSSKILNGGEVIGKASGCGYDRYGAALGEAVKSLFEKELLTLCKRVCKRKTSVKGWYASKDYYGLSYDNRTNKVIIDGACGSSCVEDILHKIGFSLKYVGETDTKKNSGTRFYRLTPLSKNKRKWIK